MPCLQISSKLRAAFGKSRPVEAPQPTFTDEKVHSQSYIKQNIGSRYICIPALEQFIREKFPCADAKQLNIEELDGHSWVLTVPEKLTTDEILELQRRSSFSNKLKRNKYSSYRQVPSKTAMNTVTSFSNEFVATVLCVEVTGNFPQ